MAREAGFQGKEKYETINLFLEEEYVLVHLDSNKKGVVLPSHLMGNGTVTLKLSRLFRGGIEVTKEQILADLLFGDAYFSCTIPLAAVWGITGYKGNNVIWPESTPPEVLEKIATSAAPQPVPEKITEKTKEAKPEKGPAKPATKKVKATKGQHLRRVK
jgi:stringent starvation protein B